VIRGPQQFPRPSPSKTKTPYNIPIKIPLPLAAIDTTLFDEPATILNLPPTIVSADFSRCNHPPLQKHPRRLTDKQRGPRRPRILSASPDRAGVQIRLPAQAQLRAPAINPTHQAGGLSFSNPGGPASTSPAGYPTQVQRRPWFRALLTRCGRLLSSTARGFHLPPLHPSGRFSAPWPKLTAALFRRSPRSVPPAFPLAMPACGPLDDIFEPGSPWLARPARPLPAK